METLLRKLILPVAVLIGLLSIPATASALKFTSAPGTPLITGATAAPGFEDRVMPTGFSPLDIASADFNGDDFDDIAVCSDASGKIYIYLGSATGALTPSTSNPVGANGSNAGRSQIFAFDIDEDGDADLVAVSQSFPAVIEVYPNGRNSGSQEWFDDVPADSLTLTNERTAAGYQSVSVGDKDDDGYPDLAVGAHDNGYWYIRNDQGLLDDPGQFVELPDESPQGNDSVYYTAMGDYDGDGKGDLVMTSEPAYSPGSSPVSTLYFARSTNDQTFANPPARLFESTPDGYLSDLQTVDLNGDQYDDLTFKNRNGATGEDATQVALGSPSGPVIQTNPGSSVSVYGSNEPAAADFNGDGKNDIALPQFVDAGFEVALGDGSGGIHLDQAGPFPLPKINSLDFYPQRTAALDVNGDGRMDFATPSGRQGDDDQARRTARGVAVMLNQPAPGISVDPTSIDFGRIAADAELIAPVSVTIRSTGNLPLDLDGIRFSGPDTSGFRLDRGDCPKGGMASGASCTLQVSMSQGRAGYFNGYLNINSDATDDPIRVEVIGQVDEPDPVASDLGLKLKSARKIKAGKKLVVTATVRNAGDVRSVHFNLKATAPKKLTGKVKPTMLRNLSIAAGQSSKFRFRIPVKRKAKGRFRVKVSLVAKRRTIKKQTGKVKVLNRKSKKKRRR